MPHRDDMAFIWNKQVTDYKVDVFRAPTLGYDRSILLTLDDGHKVSVQFPWATSTDYVDIGVSFSTVQLPVDQYDEVYHVLQTEKPVWFTAYETGTPAIRFAGFSTGPESLGEGLVDADA
jgi:hypothetical protein